MEEFVTWSAASFVFSLHAWLGRDGVMIHVCLYQLGFNRALATVPNAHCVFFSHTCSFVKLVRFEAPVLLTKNEAKLQESNHDDAWRKTSTHPTNRPAAAPSSSSTRQQNDTMISSTGQGGHTRTTLDLFSRCRQVDPVTITTLLGRLEMLEYCCMVVLFYLRKKKKTT